MCRCTVDLQQSVADVLCCPLLSGTWKLQLSALRALQLFITRFVVYNNNSHRCRRHRCPLLSLLWYCCLGDRKGIWLIKFFHLKAPWYIVMVVNASEWGTAQRTRVDMTSFGTCHEVLVIAGVWNVSDFTLWIHGTYEGCGQPFPCCLTFHQVYLLLLLLRVWHWQPCDARALCYS